MSHYEIVDRVWRSVPRWHLGEPESINGEKSFTWAFTRCEPFESRIPLQVRLQEEGETVDFTFAAFEAPILSPRAVAILKPGLAEFCEFIPIDVESQPSGFAILNVLRGEDCVDEEASELLFWQATDHRADLAGQYRQITKLVLNHHVELPPIFRLSKFKTKLLVNESIALLFERHRLSGVVLEKR